MLIKALKEVTTRKERLLIKDVRWRRRPTKALAGEKIGFSQQGMITAAWKYGCSLVTRHCLQAGETIWIKAMDELGRPLFSAIATVTWNENCFSLEGYRCEVRFRQATEAS